MKKQWHNRSGFTFIEVMIATVIFVMAALAAMDLARGSVRAVKDAEDVTTATWLLEKTLVEIEARLESEGIEKACDKKKEGTFDEPYEKYSYVTYCTEIDFRISEEASRLMGGDGAQNPDGPTPEDIMKKTMLDLVNKYISKASREIHVEVLWKQGKNPRSVDVTTHFARYDMPLPSLATGGF